MLVLLLSVFSNFGLFHCYRTNPADGTPLAERIHKSVHEIDSLLKDFQLEIRKEKSVLRTVDQEIKDIGNFDYSTAPVWRGDSQTLQAKINLITTLFPTPKGHSTNATKKPWKKLNSPGILPNYSPAEVFQVLPDHGRFPDLGYSFGHTPFNPYLTHSPTASVYAPFSLPNFVRPSRPSYPIMVSTPPTPSVPDRYFNYISFVNSTYTAASPTFRLPTKQLLPRHALRVTASKPVRGVTVSGRYKEMKRDQTGYKSYRQRLTEANRLTTLSHRQKKLGRTLSKAQAWVQNRQWLKTKKPRKILLGHFRQGSGDPAEKPPVKEKPAQVENPPVENKPAQVENPPVENKPAQVENAPVDNKPAQVENAPVDNKPAQVENAPVGETLNENTRATSIDSLETFSMPALTDIIPSLSIPGLDEVSLTSATAESPTSPTAPDPHAVDTTKTETAFTEELLQQDEHGFLFVTSPSTVHVTSERTTNTLGQILLHAENFTLSTSEAPSGGYHQLMESRDEGYLMIFFLELSWMIAHKRREDVASVLQHAERIYNEMYERGSLTFVGEDVIELGTKVSRMFSGSNIGILRSHSNMMNQMLMGRSQFLSVEVNSVIDYADMLFEDDEGESLLESLKMFEAYPNASMSGPEVCRSLIENFIKPYRRLRSTDRLRKLTDSITTIVNNKFGNRRSGAAGITPGVNTEHHQTRNKKNHQPQSLRGKLQMKRRRNFYQRNDPGILFKHQRQVDDDTTEPMMRSLLPITKHQTRFHIITPRQLRSNGYMNVVRPTVEYLNRRLGRPVHPPNPMLQLFPQAKEVELRRPQSDEEKHDLEERDNEQTLATVKDEVRRIVAESSYSDEEASLKMNLRHALRVNWHKTSTSTARK